MAMGTVGVGGSPPNSSRGGGAGGVSGAPWARRVHGVARSLRARGALGGLALAVAIAIAAPALARWLPIGAEAATFLVAALVLVGAGVRVGVSVDALERSALEDPMTAVGNRRMWEQSLGVEVERALQSRMPLSVLMVDVDNLEHLNDAHGHACGDHALGLVATVLRDTCRSRDVATRFGGDEFAVLLPRTRSFEARILAERIRSELALRRTEVGPPISDLVTVSIGIADLDGARVGGDASTPPSSLLFEAADRALYAAKSNGRNRIEVSVPRCVSGIIRLDEHRVARKNGTRGRARRSP